jgi:molybdopterin/thiamine biosynthesis adenylyltransferase
MEREVIRSRFKDAPWFPKEETSVVVGGAGGIGSWSTFFLARAGFTPMVYDFDTVEAHNMGGQLFGKKHIDMPKVEAIKDIVKEFSDTDIMVMNEKYDLNSMSHEYMFMAFDNMKARKDMFERWWAENSENPNAILIDGRLLMEHLQVFCVTKDNAKEFFDEHLFDDSEVPAESCTLKQTSHSAGMIATLMVGFFTNHIANVNNKDKGRNVPFFHEYFIPVNLVM